MAKAKTEKRLKRQKEILSQPRQARNVTRYEALLGFLLSPDSLRISDYERMVDTDETVSAALEMVCLTINHFVKDYKHADQVKETFIRANFAQCETPLDEAFNSMVSALWVGFSLTEIEFESREDGRVWLKDLHAVKPHNVEMKVDMTEGPRRGEVIEFVQNRYKTETVTIPAEKCMLFTHKGRWGNPHGLSRLRSVYKNWFIKDVLLKAWASTLEKYGSPTAIAKTDTSSCRVDDEGNETPRAEELLEALKSLQGGSVMVLDTTEELNFEQVGRAFGLDFENAQKHFNSMIFRGLLMPSLVFDSGDIGSNAMAGKHYEMFARAVWGLRNTLCNLIIKRVVGPLLDLNFGPSDDHGAFEGTVLEEEDRKLLADIFFSNVQIGLLDVTDQSDFDMMRSSLSYPIRKAPETKPEATTTGKDGLPGQAPDGSDGASPGAPEPTPRAPKKPQGRGSSLE